jgi:hypothetical protein
LVFVACALSAVRALAFVCSPRVWPAAATAGFAAACTAVVGVSDAQYGGPDAAGGRDVTVP